MSKSCGFRNIEVLQPQNHPLHKYTVYKVVYRNVDSEESVEITIYKRYSDFKKLYDKMFNIHLSLHRPNQFPTFVTANFFDRFDTEVIELRRKSSEDILKFICDNKHLYSHKCFKEFLLSGVKRSISSENNLLDISVEDYTVDKTLPVPLVPVTVSQPRRQSLDASISEDCERDGTFRSRSISAVDSTDGDACDYFERASPVLKAAERMEAERNWPMALKHYEDGIEILLVGAKADRNRARVTVVRQQVQCYLDKAEQIDRTHVRRREEEDDEETLFRLLDQCVVLKAGNTSHEEMCRFR